jgi:hypothetical protein
MRGGVSGVDETKRRTDVVFFRCIFTVQYVLYSPSPPGLDKNGECMVNCVEFHWL